MISFKMSTIFLKIFLTIDFMLSHLKGKKMIHFLRSRNESSTLSLITVYTLLVHLDLRSSDKTVSYYKMQYLLFKPYQLFTYLCLSFREEHKPTMTIFSTVCVVSYFCEPLVQYVNFFRFVIFCNRIIFYKTKL